MDAIPAEGTVLDLYAGVGLFSVCLAASGRKRLTAVEGDRTSGKDLRRNAAAYAGDLRVVVASVEDYLLRRNPRAATIIVDPPRTGMSREAMQSIVGARRREDCLRVVRSRDDGAGCQAAAGRRL